MSAGKPCVAAAVGGVPEVISDGLNGLLVPPGSLEALVRAIRWILEHPFEARRLGQEARKRVALQFDVRDMVHQYLRSTGTWP